MSCYAALTDAAWTLRNTPGRMALQGLEELLDRLPGESKHDQEWGGRIDAARQHARHRAADLQALLGPLRLEEIEEALDPALRELPREVARRCAPWAGRAEGLKGGLGAMSFG